MERINIDNNLSGKYLKRDNLLILHLTDWCNNKCKFCMVDNIHGAFSFPYKKVLDLVNTLQVGAKVDLFGGEPTLHPNFFDILRYVYTKDMLCSVATNGRLFAKSKFTSKVADITNGQLYVRTSLCGVTANDHDLTTGVTGSYDELLAGISNIINSGFMCQVNIVLTNKNIQNLNDMTRLVVSKKVQRIKFGMLVDSMSCVDQVPVIDKIRPKIVQAINIAKQNMITVTIEKAPLCLVPEYLNEFSNERALGQWTRFFDEKGECGKCVMRNWCDGLDPEYVDIFGPEGITRIDKVPATVLSPFPADFTKTMIRFLKLNLFRLPSSHFSENKCQEVIGRVMEEVQKRHATVAFIPDHLIDFSR